MQLFYLFLTVHETEKKSQTGIKKSLFLTVHEGMTEIYNSKC
jgi:hypothetical protein